MTPTLRTLADITGRMLNEPADSLNPDVPIDTLGLEDDEWQVVLEEAATVHGIPIVDIINTMPVYRIRRGDMSMAGLSDLAAFSPRARALLTDFTTQVHLDTLRSLAASLDAGRYVPSGLMSDDLHQPKTRVGFAAKYGGISAVAFALPLLNAFGPCNPICRNCYASPHTKFWEIGTYSLPLGLALVAFCLMPGFYELWDDARKRRRRGRMGPVTRETQDARVPTATPEPE